MSQEKKRPHLRVIRPEDEDRRTDPGAAPSSTGAPVKRPGDARDATSAAKSSGVESLPDGESKAAEEAAKARDD